MNVLYIWLDALLIMPFRTFANPYVSMWLGCFCLAACCVMMGNCLYKLVSLLHKKYYVNLHDNMKNYHDISMKALHSGNKEAYFAANKLAHEYFGKHFFARASVGMAALVPIPFALAWLSLRFEGIDLYTLPFTQLKAGYVFVFLSSYIVTRILWGKVVKFHRAK